MKTEKDFFVKSLKLLFCCFMGVIILLGLPGFAAGDTTYIFCPSQTEGVHPELPESPRAPTVVADFYIDGCYCSELSNEVLTITMDAMVHVITSGPGSDINNPNALAANMFLAEQYFDMIRFDALQNDESLQLGEDSEGQALRDELFANLLELFELNDIEEFSLDPDPGTTETRELSCIGLVEFFTFFEDLLPFAERYVEAVRQQRADNPEAFEGIGSPIFE